MPCLDNLFIRDRQTKKNLTFLLGRLSVLDLGFSDVKIKSRQFFMIHVGISSFALSVIKFFLMESEPLNHKSFNILKMYHKFIQN